MTCPGCGKLLWAGDYEIEVNEADGWEWFKCLFCGAWIRPADDD